MKKRLASSFGLNAIVFILLFSLGAFGEEFSSVSPFGHAQIGGNPARVLTLDSNSRGAFEAGIFGKVLEVSDYRNLNVYAFGGSIICAGMLFEYTSLDSLFMRFRSRFEGSFPRKFFGAGLAYELSLSQVMDKARWTEHNFLMGGYFRFLQSLFFSAMLDYPVVGKVRAGASVFWVRPRGRLFFSVENSEEFGFSWQIGQRAELGRVYAESSLSLPQMRLSLGIGLSWKSADAFLGVLSVSENYRSDFFRFSHGKRFR